MIRISEKAPDRLTAIQAPAGWVLRLEPRGPRRLGLTFGGPRPDDQVVQRNGREIVRVSASPAPPMRVRFSVCVAAMTAGWC